MADDDEGDGAEVFGLQGLVGDEVGGSGAEDGVGIAEGVAFDDETSGEGVHSGTGLGGGDGVFEATLDLFVEQDTGSAGGHFVPIEIDKGFGLIVFDEEDETGVGAELT